ncbi:hypothetical protein OPV22_013802 [Ensete ventricosum]|uniref:Uncharacterized protein n=1 Tax=Ensete ventricosum TaxID=4639 RepID=A0AAV8R4Q0_ENSVE|nr:hypothetical protein OPV22_013802 [Ensete ventricosum]
MDSLMVTPPQFPPSSSPPRTSLTIRTLSSSSVLDPSPPMAALPSLRRRRAQARAPARKMRAIGPVPARPGFSPSVVARGSSRLQPLSSTTSATGLGGHAGSSTPEATLSSAGTASSLSLASWPFSLILSTSTSSTSVAPPVSALTSISASSSPSFAPSPTSSTWATCSSSSGLLSWPQLQGLRQGRACHGPASDSYACFMHGSCSVFTFNWKHADILAVYHRKTGESSPTHKNVFDVLYNTSGSLLEV